MSRRRWTMDLQSAPYVPRLPHPGDHADDLVVRLVHHLCRDPAAGRADHATRRSTSACSACASWPRCWSPRSSAARSRTTSTAASSSSSARSRSTLTCGLLLVNSLLPHPLLWALYVVAALAAALDGLQRPAIEGIIPRVVTPGGAAGRQRAARSARQHGSMLLGPAAAGVMIAAYGFGWAYTLNLLTFAAFDRGPGADPGDAAAARGRPPVDRGHRGRPALRAQPTGADGYVRRRHRRDVLRHADGAVPVRRRRSSAGRRCSACSTPHRRPARCSRR